MRKLKAESKKPLTFNRVCGEWLSRKCQEKCDLYKMARQSKCRVVITRNYQSIVPYIIIVHHYKNIMPRNSLKNFYTRHTVLKKPSPKRSSRTRHHKSLAARNPSLLSIFQESRVGKGICSIKEAYRSTTHEKTIKI